MAKQLQPAGAPGRRSSALWQYAAEIRRLRDEGWTTAQIKDALAKVGVDVSERWLREWCARHLGRVRGAAPAGKTGTVPAGIPPSERAGSTGPLAREGGGKSMEDLLAAAEATSAKPKATTHKATGPDPVADLLKKLK